jgi:hypothetical protein
MLKPVEPLFVFTFCFFFASINRYKNKCGGDLSSRTTTHLRSFPNMLHNINKSNMQKDKTNGSREDWLKLLV